jgi:hypothetical protein
MNKSRFTEEQIVGLVQQHEAGVKTADLCREHGISAASFTDGPTCPQGFPGRVGFSIIGASHSLIKFQRAFFASNHTTAVAR